MLGLNTVVTTLPLIHTLPQSLNPGRNTVDLRLSSHRFPYMPHLLRHPTIPIEAPGQPAAEAFL